MSDWIDFEIDQGRVIANFGELFLLRWARSWDGISARFF